MTARSKKNREIFIFTHTYAQVIPNGVTLKLRDFLEKYKVIPFWKNYGKNVRFNLYNSEKIGWLAVSKFLSFSNSAIPNPSYKLHKFLHSLRPVGKKKKAPNNYDALRPLVS